MARFREILSNRNFLFLWIGQIISQFGDKLSQMALIGFVHQKSPGSTIELAKLILFIIVPVFIIGPIAGAYVDRWNRKHIMVASDLLRGILVLLIPVLIMFTKSTLPIYLLVFIIFSITRFFLSGKMAIIPSIVPREHLLVANSLSDTTRIIAAIIGIGFAGLVVSRMGVIGSFYIDSATFFLSATLLSTIALRSTGPRLKEGLLQAEKAMKEAIKKSIFKEIKDGLGYFIKLRNIRFVASIWLLIMSGAGAIICVTIVFIQESFGSVTADLGLLGMFLAVGLFIGAVIYGRFGQRLKKSKVIFSSLTLTGIGVVLFAVLVRNFHSFRATAALNLVIGMFASPIVVSSNTLVHEALPEDVRGRVFSSLEAIAHLGFLVCMLLSSFLAEVIDRMWILVCVGSVFALFGIVGVFLDKRKV